MIFCSRGMRLVKYNRKFENLPVSNTETGKEFINLSATMALLFHSVPWTAVKIGEENLFVLWLDILINGTSPPVPANATLQLNRQ
jgi:hypothetical protein